MRRTLKNLILVTILGFAESLLHAQCVPNSSSRVFNASHDLRKVTVGNKKYGDLKPNESSIDSTARLNAALLYVSENSDCTKLVVDPGTYYFHALSSNGRGYLELQNSSKAFDFRGASLVFEESYYTDLFVDNCNQCTVSGFSIDYVHLPFTQLNVTQVTQDQSIVVEPQGPNWSEPQDLYNHQAKFGSVTLYGFDTRGGTPLYGYSRWTLTTPLPRQHRLFLNPYGVIQAGDVFVVAARGGGPTIRIENSRASSFKNITIHTSAGPGVETWYSQGISLIDVNVVPGSSGGQNFLASTAAGGIELNAISGPGNLVSNSTIQNAQDDSIAGNLTADNAVLYSVTTGGVTICDGPPPPTSNVFLVNIATGESVGDPLAGKEFNLTAGGSNAYSVSPAFAQHEAKELLPGAAIYSAAQLTTSNYVVVENNIISNSYLARGIAFSGVGGIRISHNVITNTQQAGIFLGTDLPGNGPVIDALIADNRLTATNLGMSGVGTDMLGAIEVMSFSQAGGVITGQPNQKIFIRGNVISGTQRSGVWIANVNSGDVDASNSISGYGQEKTSVGIDAHLNFGIGSSLVDAFRQQVVGWCDRNVSGITFHACNQKLEPSSDFSCLRP